MLKEYNCYKVPKIIVIPDIKLPLGVIKKEVNNENWYLVDRYLNFCTIITIELYGLITKYYPYVSDFCIIESED